MIPVSSFRIAGWLHRYPDAIPRHPAAAILAMTAGAIARAAAAARLRRPDARKQATMDHRVVILDLDSGFWRAEPARVNTAPLLLVEASRGPRAIGQVPRLVAIEAAKDGIRLAYQGCGPDSIDIAAMSGVLHAAHHGASQGRIDAVGAA